MNNNSDFDVVKEIFSWISIIVVAAVIALVLNLFIIANSRVPSASMENTIMTGDRVVGFRLTYLFQEPKRGDIIIFKFPDDESLYYIQDMVLALCNIYHRQVDDHIAVGTKVTCNRCGNAQIILIK